MEPDDAYWRRPAENDSAADPAPSPTGYPHPWPGAPPRSGLPDTPPGFGPTGFGPTGFGPPGGGTTGGGPASGGPASGGAGLGGGPNPIYHGPPVTMAPPAGWRPNHIVEPAPPRRLPEQNHAAIDDREARARTLTVGLAIVAGAIMLIALCAVCGRSLF